MNECSEYLRRLQYLFARRWHATGWIWHLTLAALVAGLAFDRSPAGDV
jgi:hypothetical protein